MLIDEVIKMMNAEAECLNRTNCDNNCDNCELCYEQGTIGEKKECLAQSIEWLVDYRNTRNLPNPYSERLYKNAYNKALEDLIIQVRERLIASSDDDYYEWGRTSAFNRVIEIARQLKKGESND